MNQELLAPKSNQTWIVAQLPLGKQVSGSKLVYKIKYKLDGTIEKYKAHLVAKRFTQVEGIDYTHTFSPIAKLTTMHLVIAVVVIKSWHIY